LGQPLPRDLRRYPLPYELRRQLGRAPAGHEYVRVAGDILLITIGAALVVDAIEDLGGY
jgi:Ni/Co efflux regulator RcnB